MISSPKASRHQILRAQRCFLISCFAQPSSRFWGTKSKLKATGDHEVSNYYVLVSAPIFALVAVGHLVRIFKRWTVKIGPLAVPMSLSWAGLVIAAPFDLGLCKANNRPGNFSQ